MSRSRCASSVLFALSLIALFPRPAAAGYEVISVAESGSINGKVLFDGPVPTRKIVPTKDREACGKVHEEPVIAIGAGKGVQDAVVYVKSLTKGKPWPRLDQPAALSNKGCKFVPRVQAVPVGTRLVTVNEDPVLHNTHSFLGRSTVYNVALPTQGQRIEKQLKSEGLVRFECDAHGWMRGWVYVAENPYYAVTTKDGSFSIGDVPPGSYTLVAWQEYAGETEIPVIVEPRKLAVVTVELKKK